MQLILKSHKNTIPALGATDGMPDDKRMVYVKLFCGAFTWYVYEFDGDTAFGYVRNDASPHDSELGYFSIHELESIAIPMNVKIGATTARVMCKVERDIHFTPITVKALKEAGYHA